MRAVMDSGAPFSEQFFEPWNGEREDGSPVPYRVVYTDDAMSIRDAIVRLEDRIALLERLCTQVVKAWNSQDGRGFTESLRAMRAELPHEM